MSSDEVYAAAELGDEHDGGEWVRRFAGLVDDSDALALLQHYDAVLDVPVEDTELGREILESQATGTIDDAVRAGNVSQMKRSMGLTSDTDDEKELLYQVVDWLSNEGCIGLLVGSPGSGKTTLSLDVARMWQAMTGGVLIGNTEWDGFETVVKSDSEMLEAMAEVKGPVLAVIDETTQSLSGYGEQAKPAEQFSNSLTMVRKREGQHGPYAKQGSVMLVSHRRTDVAKAFRELAVLMVQKPSPVDKGRAYLYESESDSDDWERTLSVEGLTDTQEEFEEHENSEFVIVGETEETEEEPDPMEPGGETWNRQARASIEAAAEGQSYREIAESPGMEFGRQWVGERVREYKSGQHRDLWDDDTPTIED